MPNMYTPCDEVEFKLNRAIEEEAKAARVALYMPFEVFFIEKWSEYTNAQQDHIHACALTDDARRDYNALPGVKYSG